MYSQMGSKARAEQNKRERKKKAQEGDVSLSTCACGPARSCDSVTTARLLELRDCRCQSLSPLFYCETTQVFPVVCMNSQFSVGLCVSDPIASAKQLPSR